MREMLENKLVKILFYIISVVTLINGLFFIGIGIYSSAHVWYDILTQGWITEHKPGIHLLEAVDVFLVAVVVIVLSHGLKSLVTTENKDHFHKIDKDRLHTLKDTLWRSVLTVLVVHFLAVAFTRNTYEIDILYLPGAIFLLTGALFFMTKSERKH
jgi:uncharacterized membrane protein YqhA